MFVRRVGLSLLFLAVWAVMASADVVLQRKFLDGTKFKTREAVKVKQSLVLSGNDLGTESSTAVISQSTYGRPAMLTGS